MKEVHDANYWKNYYRTGVAPETPSLFAQYVNAHFIRSTDRIVDLGCGNGRDSRYLAASNPGALVIGIDQCAKDVGSDDDVSLYSNLRFAVGDFTTLPDSDPLDIIYSRFTLHSVTADQQQRTLDWAHRNMADDGTLCIETRGKKNEFYRLGTPVDGEEDAYIYEDHYRRFVDLGQFVTTVTESAFEVIDATEKTGFAPFKDTDQHFIRLFAKKQ